MTAEMGNLFFRGPIGEQERRYWEETERPTLQRYQPALWLVVLTMTLLWPTFRDSASINEL